MSDLSDLSDFSETSYNAGAAASFPVQLPPRLILLFLYQPQRDDPQDVQIRHPS